MTPDAATQAFLDALKAAGRPPVWQLTVDEMRASIRAASLQLAAPSTEVQDVAERRMPVPGGDIGLRVYLPRRGSPDRPLPIVVHFHGAGFVAGDLDTHDSIARFHCQHAEAVVIAVDYRLAPEHPFPAAVEDAYAAVEWAVEHARELRGDAGRIAVIGDSAGANLAAVVCQLVKVRNGPRVAYQALVYPVVDFRSGVTYPSAAEFGGGDFFLSNRDMEYFRSCYLDDVARHAGDPAASPLVGDLGGLPPALVVTAGCDPLHDEGKAYADRLAAAGVPVEYRCFESTIHAFMSFARAIPVAVEGLSFVAARLRAALHAA
ncbi:MAG: alpha/beta hydrolase [Acidobacteriota bacterium]